MKFLVGLICLTLAIGTSSAPQAGPNLNLPRDSYSPRCQPRLCPSSGIYNTAFPPDCLQYVQCTDGVAKTTACPPDEVWHEAAGKCADPKVAKCTECWRSK